MSLCKTILNFFVYLVFFLQVISAITTSALKLQEYVGDKGKNLTIPCKAANNTTSIMWIKDDQHGDEMKTILENGSLVLTDLTVNSSGVYTCFIVSSIKDDDGDGDNIENSTSSTEFNEDSTEIATAIVTSISSSSSSSSSSSNNNNNNKISRNNTNSSNTLIEFYKARVRVRTAPRAVAYIGARVTTIVGLLMWKFYSNQTGGYAIRCFTADYRELPEDYGDVDDQNPEWLRLDPTHITPNARQLEVYGLKPNTTYEFRIFASNHLGPGDIATTTVTTLAQMEEKDLIRLIMVDAKNFDTRVWIIAVSIVLGTLIVLSVGTSILLCKECREPSVIDEDMDSVELVPNIILNPGFCDSDDQRPPSPIYIRTIIYDNDYDSDDEEPISFKRKLTYFFTGDSIKRL